MARITVEDCLDKVPSRFALVMLVAKRAKQLMKGSTATLPARDNKCIVQALREVAAENVMFDQQSQNDILEQISQDLARNQNPSATGAMYVDSD